MEVSTDGRKNKPEEYFQRLVLISINFSNFRILSVILRYNLKYTKENITILISDTKINLCSC